MSWLHHLASHKTRKQDNIAFIHTASTVQTSLRHPADMCIHIHAQKTVRKDTPTPYLCSGVISRLQKMGQLRNALCQRPRPLPVLLPIRTARLWLLQTKLQVFVHTHTRTQSLYTLIILYFNSDFLLSLPDCGYQHYCLRKCLQAALASSLCCQCNMTSTTGPELATVAGKMTHWHLSRQQANWIATICYT